MKSETFLWNLAKTLRVLQEQEFERLGSNRTHKVDVRVIAATHRDLAAMVKQTTFRKDGYYRLKVFPSTFRRRQRTEDIPEPVWHFAELYARRMNKRIDEIPSETMDALVRYRWPGKRLDLSKTIVRAAIFFSVHCIASPAYSNWSHFMLTRDQMCPDCNRVSMRKLKPENTSSLGLKCSNWVVGGPNGAAEALGMKRDIPGQPQEMLWLQINRPVSAGLKSVVESRKVFA